MLAQYSVITPQAPRCHNLLNTDIKTIFRMQYVNMFTASPLINFTYRQSYIIYLHKT